MASAGKKWAVSRKTWEGNRQKNLQQVADNYKDNALVQALQDAVNAKYDKNDYGKYYFRNDNYKKEFDNIVNDFTKNQINDIQNALSSASTLYDPIYGGGFNNNFADQYVNNYLDDKYALALEQLDRAKARGTLNDVGYGRALKDLDTQKSAGYSTLGNIGRSIVSDYNTGMQTNIENYQNLLNNYDLTRDYSRLNTNNINNMLNQNYNNYLAGFEGDFNAAMGGQEPFDVSSILGNAKVSQGITNPQSNPLVNALSDQNSKKQQKVGLGNEGVF